MRKSAAYESVDTWSFGQQFLSSGDVSDSTLWLSSITHTGLVGGTAAMPALTFAPAQLVNRVDSTTDGLSPLSRFRIGSITSETGQLTTIAYSDPDCSPGNVPSSPDSNTRRCFPQKWTPPGNTSPRTDWFHKYVVTEVTNTDTTALGTPVSTYYAYSGGAAWAYNNDKLLADSYRTWSNWRGYGTVTTTVGDPSLTTVRSSEVDTFFRGMDGDKQSSGTPRNVSITDSTGSSYPDSRELVGFKLESETLSGVGGSVQHGTISTPWSHLTAGSGLDSAHFVKLASKDSRDALAAGGFRHDVVTTSYDSTSGEPTLVSDTGATDKTGDETCRAVQYADTQTVSGAWFVGFIARVVASKGTCGTNALTPTESNVLSDSRARFDQHAQGVAPSVGNVTQTDRLASYVGATPQYQVVTTNSYDANGRIISCVVPVNGLVTRTTTTAYTMSSDGTLASTTVTQDSTGKAFATTTTNAPEWGTPTQTTDPNSRVSKTNRDPLGRISAAWAPNRALTATPTTKFAYSISKTAPLAITTSTLNRDGSAYNSAVTIYDSMLRSRETQAPSPSGGRIVGATVYDARGLVSDQADNVYASGSPSATLVQFSDGDVPQLTRSTYDGMGRVVEDALYSYNAHKWSTTTTYGGTDVTTVNPPNGSPSITTTTDVTGQVVQRVEHGSPDLITNSTYDLHGNLTRVDGPAGTWTYGYDLRNRRTNVTDPDSGPTQYTFTDDDNIATSQDARGTSTLTVYDSLDRRTALYSGSTATPTNLLASWAYDTLAKGQLTSSTRYVGGQGGDSFTTKVTAYDSMYHVTSSTFTLAGAAGSSLVTGLPASMTQSMVYNVDQTLSVDYLPKVAAGTQTALSAEALSYGYNSLGMQTSVQGRTAILQNVVYDAVGRGQQYVLGQGSSAQLSVTNSFDDGTDRVTRSLAATNLSSTVVSDHHYTYDDAGNPLEDSDTATGDTQCFNYDTHQRLSQAWTPSSADCAASPSQSVLGGPAPYWQSWTYTGTGLRKTQTTVTPNDSTTDTYTYPSAGSAHQNFATGVNRVETGTSGSSIVDLAYGVDDSGNTVARPDPAATGGTSTTAGSGEQSLTWNAEGDLSSLTRPGGAGTTTYVYGIDGSLLLSDSPQQKTLYFGETQVNLNKVTGALTASRNYSTVAGLVATRTSDNQVQFLIPDAHGTAGVVLDGQTLTPHHRYMAPFGESRGVAGSAWDGLRGYLGAASDADTGLTSLGQRQYDVSTGRFICADPVVDTTQPAQMLGYAYSGNNPMFYSDPSGEMYQSDFGPPASHNYSTRHEQANEAAADQIRGEVAASGYSGTSVHTDRGYNTVRGGAKKYMKLSAPGDANGYPDILFEDSNGVLHVWETKVAGQAGNAVAEAEWYVKRLNRTGQPAVLGWVVAKGQPFDSRNESDTVQGMARGAVVYYRKQQRLPQKIQRKVDEAQGEVPTCADIPAVPQPPAPPAPDGDDGSHSFMHYLGAELQGIGHGLGNAYDGAKWLSEGHLGDNLPKIPGLNAPLPILPGIEIPADVPVAP